MKTSSMPWSADKPQSIQDMFGQISPYYDVLNTLFSFGLHWFWKRKLVASSKPGRGARVLDCATGSGDVAFLFEKIAGPDRVTGIDPCRPLLEIARSKAEKRGTRVSFVEGDLMALPFADGSFDIVSISFGIRNVADPSLALRECGRVLRPGGSLVILESGEPESSWMKRIWNFYFRRIVAPLGALITGTQAYRYLHESSAKFPSGKNFLALASSENHLFASRTYQPLGGGACYIYRFFRK